MKNKNTAIHTAYDVIKTYLGNVPHLWNKDGKRNKNVTTEKDFFVSDTGFMIVHERSNPRDKDNEDALERMLDNKPKDYGIYGKGIWWHLTVNGLTHIPKVVRFVIHKVITVFQMFWLFLIMQIVLSLIIMEELLKNNFII